MYYKYGNMTIELHIFLWKLVIWEPEDKLAKKCVNTVMTAFV
jgi:hypothetical protein